MEIDVTKLDCFRYCRFLRHVGKVRCVVCGGLGALRLSTMVATLVLGLYDLGKVMIALRPV